MRRLDGDGQWRYLALYELETDDPDAAMAELRRRAGGPSMPMSEALDRGSLFSGLFQHIIEMAPSNAPA